MIEYSTVIDPTPALLAGITALYRAAGWWGDGPDDPEGLARMIAGSHCVVVALTAGEVVGMGRALSDGVSDAYLHDVMVRSDLRGRGIATGLVQRLVESLHADGLRWIGVIADSGSHPLYRPLGFAPMELATPMLKQD